MPPSNGPLLVFGPRSTTYDFGSQHPLTPRRFGPGIDLLRAVGAKPGLAPEPATDDELLAVHIPAYVDAVKGFSAEPELPARAGIGPGDNPAFAGMHEAGAAVAGGSIRAIETILRGDVEHAHHPGGGLHHAMPDRASGFCIYDDPALAVVRARAAGLRVLYVDLDVHHGDGVQAICWVDSGVLTLSLHESGRYLFPGTGFPDELGPGAAAGTSVNLPFEPSSGEDSWLPAVRALVPTLAAVFGPDVVVSQHGADSHAWDPLARLRVTTRAMAEAARIVDAVAHRWASGRWLATGGGGYDVYRVVPRTWALTWLAGAHREPPDDTPAAWRERWAGEAAGFGTPGMPDRFIDAPNAGRPVEAAQAAADARSLETLEAVRRVVLPRLVREAEDRGWWRPELRWAGQELAGMGGGRARSTATSTGSPGTDPPQSDAGRRPAVVRVTAAMLDRLVLAPRVVTPFDPADARAILLAALGEPGTSLTAAVDATTIVGLALSVSSRTEPGVRSLVALGVAPAYRRAGLATRLLSEHLASVRPGDEAWEALITVAERDVVEPLDAGVRRAIARRLLDRAGFVDRPAPAGVARIDPGAVAGRLGGR